MEKRERERERERHTLSIETGRYRQHWLTKRAVSARTVPMEKWRPSNTSSPAAPTINILETPFYPKFETLCPDFKLLNKKTQIQYLLGEKQDCILLAARYIDACHKKREESTNQWCAHNTHTHTKCNFKLFIAILKCWFGIFFFPSFLFFYVCMHECFVACYIVLYLL